MNPFSDHHDFTSRLTENALASIRHAEGIARTSGSPYIGTEHLLLGILAQESSLGAKMLSGAGVTLNKAKLALNVNPAPVGSIGSKGLSEVAKLTLNMAYEIAQDFNQGDCGTEHILLSILSQKNARASEMLRSMGVAVDPLINELEQFLNRQQGGGNHLDSVRKQKKGRKTALDFFGTDLTAKAREHSLDPVIGRDAQLARVITILSRRTKNNPVLIGEPGVGKTAIVEGLAAR